MSDRDTPVIHVQLEELEEAEEARSRLYSRDKRLDHLLQNVISEVKAYAGEQNSQIKRLTQIGLALSSEKDLDRLLEMILSEARHFTCADAGTLYLVDRQANQLRFAILQNVTLGSRIAGMDDVSASFPSIPLEKDGEPNFSNVASYVALSGDVVNMVDVYDTTSFDFTGPKHYDAMTGYRSKSMLVIPMKNHQNETIGVLQLLNAQEPGSGKVTAFSEEHMDLIGSLASQAAVALTNAQLIQELKNLFYSFIRSIATAIDEKSPFTGGHVRRVAGLTTMIAGKINETDHGPFADVHFTEAEMEEIHLAAWMHDVGKITTPEHVIDKHTKLEAIVDRIELVDARFDLIRRGIENDHLRTRLSLLERGLFDRGASDELNKKMEAELKTLEEERGFVKACNSPLEPMNDEKIARLQEIAAKTYQIDGREHPYLTADEASNLSTRNGSLTDDERRVIEKHVLMTIEILKELPFPKGLSRLVEFAAGHHEKLDGSGYPFGLRDHQLPLQARIIAVADVFEALTSRDRPYKEPMKVSQAVEILRRMKDQCHIDPDVFDLLIESGLHTEYAQRELNLEQEG